MTRKVVGVWGVEYGKKKVKYLLISDLDTRKINLN